MDTTSQQGQSSLEDEQIGKAYFASATYNRGRSHGFPPKWSGLDNDVKQSYIQRGKIFLQSLARQQEQSA